jgi:hypothetical protein
MRLRSLAVLLSLLSLCTAASAQKRYALLIASGDFAPKTAFQDKALQAPKNDTRLMASLLTWRFGFRAGDVMVLGVPAQSIGNGYQYAGAQSTLRAIEQGFQWLKKTVKPEDTVVVYYSGHGTRILDPTAKQPGYQYEALVTYEATQSTLLRDVQLRQWLTALKSKNVCLILDTCYSAGAARLAMPETLEEMQFTYATKGASSRDLVADNPSSPSPTSSEPGEIPYIALVACGKREKARELRIRAVGGREETAVSAFTLMLYRTLCWNPQDLTYKELLEKVRTELSKLSLPQTPEVIGQSANRSLILSQSIKESRPRFPLLNTNPLQLQIGALGGVRSTMRFEEGGTKGEGARVEAIRTDWFTTDLKLIRGSRIRASFLFPIP